MIVVSDTSPLIALSAIGQVDLLPQLYNRVLAPEAVWQELLVGRHLPGRETIIHADWIERRTVQNQPFVLALQKDLDRGEAEAITLAIESDASLLIIDERIGRRTARHFKLDIIGVIGVLIDAKHRGLITEVKLYLDQLRTRAGFLISDALYRQILADEHESSESADERATGND